MTKGKQILRFLISNKVKLDDAAPDEEETESPNEFTWCRFHEKTHTRSSEVHVQWLQLYWHVSESSVFTSLHLCRDPDLGHHHAMPRLALTPQSI